jgi:hypothetical protein
MESQTKVKPRQKRNRGNDEEIKYRKRIMVRYNEKQYEYIIKKAEQIGIQPAKLVRDISLKSNITIISKYDLLTYNQIIKIGVNINQIAKRINTISASDELKPEYEKLKIFIKELKEIFHNK